MDVRLAIDARTQAHFAAPPGGISWRSSAGVGRRGKIRLPSAAPYRSQWRRMLPLAPVLIVMVWGTRLPVADVGPEQAADDGAAESPGGRAEGIGESGSRGTRARSSSSIARVCLVRARNVASSDPPECPMPALRLAAVAAFAFFASVALAEISSPSPAVLRALAAPQALPDVVEGRADAPATIIEYASLTCSHCAAFHKDAWPAIKAKYIGTGKAKFILREFPLDPLSVGAFMLARCAGARREAVIDRLFDHQSEWAFTANPLFHLKQQVMAIGMSETGFDACLKNQALYDAVRKMHDDAAAKLQVKSTPTFFVDGVEFAGEHALDRVDDILPPAAK